MAMGYALQNLGIPVLALALVAVAFSGEAESDDKDDLQYFLISKSWNNSEMHPDLHTLFILKPYKSNDTSGGLYIYLNVPFFNDPSVPDDIPPGSLDKLWNYEVFELFLQGENGNYLEIELAPKGHYFLLELNDKREVLRYGLPLENYKTIVDASDGSKQAGRWHAGTFIPCKYLPRNIKKFNAYSIHKSDPNRIYMALSPTPRGKYEKPDFHRLEYFKDIKFRDMC